MMNRLWFAIGIATLVLSALYLLEGAMVSDAKCEQDEFCGLFHTCEEQTVACLVAPCPIVGACVQRTW